MAQDPKSKETASSLQSLEGEINQASSAISLDGKKIVWVEDDNFLANIITRKFSATKCKLLHFSEGTEALKAISTELPDAVVLDILLPGMDGFEILSKIKEDPKTKNIPVIMLSNLGQPSDIKKGKSLGADHFMVKATVAPDEIVGQIKDVLDKNKK